MMQVACPLCHRTLQFSGEAPAFCGYCGKPLPKGSLSVTAEFDPEALTLPPTLASAPPADERVDAVGSYRLIRQLGAGGMGRVFEAEDKGTGRRVAVKLIAREFAASAEALERFRKEGRLASGIAHPRCVFVLAADEEAGRPYIVMELMQGATLKDLVDERGPLPPEEAVRKILDVLEGLEEAHRLGVMHRDMKPSNCFLEPDGRVKVGDFGLAKSLVDDSHLTRTGAFLGTPLFASPEQIRKDPLTPQSDVYSVAATLYFLLIGKAPFDSGDPAATMARIVADPAPSVRTLRPEIPVDLERVVLRGLERQKDRRWPDLASFRSALSPFVPAPMSTPTIGLRIAAYLIDWIPFALLFGVISSLSSFKLSIGGEVYAMGPWRRHALALAAYLGSTIGLSVYFTVAEGIWGCSLGKWLLGLRVHPPKGNSPPGLVTALWRTLAFMAITRLPCLAVAIIEADYLPENAQNESKLSGPLFLIGHLLLLITMRARNGFRGPHELVSKTRVVRLPWRESAGSRRVGRARPFQLTMTTPAGLPERIGAYFVDGAIRWEPNFRVVRGQDRSLERTVWIWLRPTSEPPVDPARQRVNRMTRLRWLTSGKIDDWQWDAFLSPSGYPLPEMARIEGKLPWPTVRPMLEQLADELDEAIRDETLPAALSLDQVWIQRDGQVQLVENLESQNGAKNDLVPPKERAVEFFREAAVLALEGIPWSAKKRGEPLRAVVPEHGARIINRLLRADKGRMSLADVRADLLSFREKPLQVTRSWRGAHLVLLASLLSVPLIIMFAVPLLGLSLCQLGYLMFLHESAAESERELKALETASVGALAAGLISLDEASRLASIGIRTYDLRLEEQLRQQLDQQSRAEDNVHRLARPLARFLLAYARPYIDIVDSPQGHFRIRVEPPFQPQSDFIRAFIPAVLVTSLLFPTLWVVWAFIVRGAVSLRLMALCLVRTSGRPAFRIQCAWRAFVTWVPVVGLLILSALLDFLPWAGGVPGSDFGLTYWLSWMCWVFALALLPAYAAMAIRSPQRSLHDRLAGTYLVPR
jgi:hypothetical protein